MSHTELGAGEWIAAAVDRYERPLLRYVARMVGDEERARDVVQDAFLRLWQADRDRIEDHLGQWLYTVCRNRALDDLRKDGRMKALKDGQATTEPGPTRGVAAAAEAKDARVTVFGLVESLPPRQQELIRLKFQGGLSYREMGEVMNLTVSHVGVLIHTALKTIRQRLETAETGVFPESSINPPVAR